ncbi:GDP-mannose 4,6-dehydratase [Candidatus Woesearchaeota archaeon]|jgi:GDPmannose 4,6-dehydratase|nr:GDP-mannose 4,6-dehydratase [Candidatus Woesearchaeota archaeon]MBT6023074.1 GDP-mannose 4,6-dehydratase [Candidatus Woesearchaeota archaeon]
MKTALITGITGQDGSYLAEFLLEKGYKVYGLERRNSSRERRNITQILDKIELINGDLLDQASIIAAIKESNPDEIYNLAAQSFVGSSWGQPEYTGNVTALGALRVLEAIRQVNPKIKYYQASSSEMFGKVKTTPQDESTQLHPRSPYGVAKCFAHWITQNYRESYGMFCVSGILFNHESPRRGEEFVTRKVTKAVARIKYGKQKELRLGNLDAERDWGHARDYVEAMWLMMQQDKPEDFVIGTGISNSVRTMVETAFNHIGLNYKDYVVVDPKFFRPAEVEILLADASKAEKILNWKPKKTFKDLIIEMVDNDLKLEK